MRFPLHDIPHRIRLLLAEVRHSAERATDAPGGLQPGTAQISQLEQRLLMSASPAAAVVEAPTADAAQSASVDAILDEVFGDADGNPADGNGAGQSAETASLTPAASAVGSGEDANATTNPNDDATALKQLVVIDAAVEQPDRWIAELARTNSDFDVLVLEQDEDGISRITDYLSEMRANDGQQFGAIHIVSHGADGQAQLGNATLSNSTFANYRQQLQSWSSAIGEDGDVLFYGCDLAATEDGEQLVKALAELWSSDVAASDDDTGHEDLNADWDLEFHVGQINTSIAFSAAHQQNWFGTLSVSGEPSHTLPKGQTVLKNRVLEFSAAAGNQIQVADSDNGSNDLMLTLEVTAGTLTIDDAGTASYTLGDGLNDSEITLQGTVAELNAALATFWFTADTDYTGPVELTITTNDMGNGGTLTAQETTDTVSLLVHEEYTSNNYVVSATALDELNRNTHRGVSRSIATTASGNLVSVWKNGIDEAKLQIHDVNNNAASPIRTTPPGVRIADVSVATGQREEVVIVWSQGAAGSEDVYFSWFSEVGDPIGAPVAVTTAAGSQQAATIARNAAGEFVVAWESSTGGIEIQRYSATGTALHANPLSVGTEVSATNASVGIDRDGNVLVGWQDSNGHQVRYFDGTNWGAIDVLSTANQAGGSALSMAEDGTAVVAWHEQGANWAVRFQRFDPGGVRVGSIDSAASVPAGDEQNPSVAMAENGDFVIAWETNADIQARRFAANGNPLSSDIYIASNALFENNASVAAVSSTDFAVLYTVQDGDTDVRVQRVGESVTDSTAPVVVLPDEMFVTANTTQTETALFADSQKAWTTLGFGFAAPESTLVGISNISLIEDDAYRGLEITPEPDQIGSTVISITAHDLNGNSTTESVNVYVTSPTLVVDTTADENDGNTNSILELIANPGGTGISLREAIIAANNTANHGREDRIEFDIGGGGQQTILLTSELPDITDAVFIDGTSQTGYANSPLIGLDGTNVDGNGFSIRTDDTTIQGFALFDFQRDGFDADTGNGILIDDGSRNAILGNFIGLTQAGTESGNDRHGIRIVGDSDRNMIGGNSAARRNVVSGNNGHGIVIIGQAGSPSDQNRILNNYLGTSVDGQSAIGNIFSGISLQHADGAIIRDNVVSGNQSHAIRVFSLTTAEVTGNLIGVAADGTTTIGNIGSGIYLSSTSQVEIGGANSGDGNTITGNNIGVRMASGGGTGNLIRRNQIYDNTGLGIDIEGVDTNDASDSDGGTNNGQNYPVLATADLTGTTLSITGSLNSTPNMAFDIDIYSSSAGDPSGSGEAEDYIGSFSVTTNGSGNATFNQSFSNVSVLAGDVLTAIATDPTWNSSEFAQNVTVIGPTPTNLPPSISLNNVLVSVDENTDTTSGLKIADILITDDGEGLNVLSLAGADAADFEIVGTELRLRANTVLDFESQPQFNVQVNVDDAAIVGSPDDSETVQLTVNNLPEAVAQTSLWFATQNATTDTDAGSGASSWGVDSAVVLSDPNLNLGANNNDGHFQVAWNLNDFADDGAAELFGLHVVTRDINVGSVTPFTLNAGDLLFTVSESESFNGLSVTESEVMLFRPDTAGDYSSGTVSILYDNLGGTGFLNAIKAISLVEETTTIGNQTVQAGTLLYTTTRDSRPADIRMYEADTLGENNTTGLSSTLLDLMDLGLADPTVISGLEVIETATTIGGENFLAGDLLIASTSLPTGLTASTSDVWAFSATNDELNNGATAGLYRVAVDGDSFGTDRMTALSLGPQQSLTTAFVAAADTYLSKDNDTTNYGTDDTLDIDKSGGALGDVRAIVQFDLSTMPADAVITSAWLRMEAVALSDSFEIGTYRLEQAWTETGATYEERVSGTDWQNRGGSVAVGEIDSLEVTQTGIHHWDVTSVVQDWLNGTHANHGLMIASGETGHEDVEFASREHATADAPQLVIEYTSASGGIIDQTPIAVAGGPYTINEGGSLTVDASGSSDPDNGTLTYTWDLDNDGSFDDATGVNPTINWNSLPSAIRDDGTYTISVAVNDGTSTSTASTTVTVNNVAPTAADDSGAALQTDEDSAVTLNNLLNNDVDPAGNNDPLSITAVDTSGTSGTVSMLSSTSISYDPNGQFESLQAGETATDSFTYTISDGDGGTHSATVTITINGRNDAPSDITATLSSVAENSNGAVVGTVSVTDADTTDSHTWTVDDSRFEVVGGNLRLRSGQSLNYESQQSVDVEVTAADAAGATYSETFTVTVTDENDVPPTVISNQTFTISENASDGAVVGSVNATDADSMGTLQGWTITSGNGTGGGVFDIDINGTLTVADSSQLDAAGTPFYDLQVRVSDGVQTSAARIVRVNVAANSNPVAIDDVVTVAEGGTVSSSSGDWFHPSWSSRRTISIDNSAINSNLNDYPLRLRFHASDASAIVIDYSDFAAGGADLVFVDPDGTVLAHEVEHWDASGYSDVWVKVPRINAAATDSITMYYGSTATNPSPAASEVWDADEVGVFHLDSEPDNSNGSPTYQNPSNVTTANGVSGRAFTFNGSDSEVVSRDSGLDNVFQNGGTISAWIYPSDWGENNYGRIADKADTHLGFFGNGDGWSFQVDGTVAGGGRLAFSHGFSFANGHWVTPVGSISLNQWQHVSVSFTGNAGDTPVFTINGIVQNVTTRLASIGSYRSDVGNDLTIGNYSQATDRTFDGIIDEVRIVKGMQSTNELRAQYRDIAAPVVSAGTVQSNSGILANDSDADADSLTVSLVSGPSHAANFNLAANGSFSYEHDGSETTSDSFVYRISDGAASSTATVYLTVTPVNDAPVVNASQSFSVAESAASGATVGQVLATDPDSGATFSNWQITSGNGDGNFEIDSATGIISVAAGADLDYESTTSYSLGIRVSDGSLTSAARTVTIQVTDENDSRPIVALNQSFSVSEAAGAINIGTVAATDFDTVGTLSGWSIVSGNNDGHFAIDSATGTISLTQPGVLDRETASSHVLAVTVSDGVQVSESQNVTINVTDVNDTAPVITAGQQFNVNENFTDTNLGLILATDSDITGSLQNWTITAGNGDGNFVLNSSTGRLSVSNTADLDYEDTQAYSLTITVSDGVQTSTPQTVVVRIRDLNDTAPSVQSGLLLTVNENAAAGTSVGTVTANDPDTVGSLQNWTIAGGNTGSAFAIDSSTGEITVAAGATIDYETRTSYTLQVTVNDGSQTSSPQDVTINVNPINDNAPAVTAGQSFYVAENSAANTFVGTIAATDADSPTTFSNWTIVSGNVGNAFTIDTATGQLRVAAGASIDFESRNNYTLQVTVDDGVHTSAQQAVVINVTNVNDVAPVVTPNQTFRIAENAPDNAIVGTIAATDAEVFTAFSNWTISSGNDDGQFTLNANTGLLRLAANHSLNYSTQTQYQLEVTVSDGTNVSAVETVTVNIDDVDLPPRISTIADRTTDEDTSVLRDFVVNDPDTATSTLVITATSSDQNIVPDSGLRLTGANANRRVIATPAANAFGSTTITITVSDGTTSVSEDFQFTFTAVNDPPTVAAISDQTVDEDGTLTVTLDVDDIDSPASAINVSASSSNQSLLADSNLTVETVAGVTQLQMAPTANQSGSTTITVVATDGQATTTRTFRLDVQAVNDAPVMTGGNIFESLEQSSKQWMEAEMLAGVTDIDSTNLQVVVDQAPANGTFVQLPSGEFEYRPDRGFFGTDTFTYVVSDGEYQTTSRSVTIEVEAAAPAPATGESGVSVVEERNETSENSESATGEERQSESVEEANAVVSVEEVGNVAANKKVQQQAQREGESGQEAEPEVAAIALVRSNSSSEFLFRKIVTIAEAKQDTVHSSDLDQQTARESQSTSRRIQMDESFDAGLQFQNTDWQFYSDLSKTVGGVGEFREGLKNEFAAMDFTTGTITLAGTSVAVGFVVTAVRSGMLALGFLSQLPMWTLFDPLMVVDGVTGEESEGDSLEDIVDRQAEIQNKQRSQNLSG